MSSTADQTSKNTSEISHCKLSIGFSLSWESMHFRHLASEEYDLFDPLNHVWEGVKKKKNRRRTTDWLSRKQSRRYSSEGDRREGRGRSVGRRAHSEEKKGRHFYFDFLTPTYDNSILLLFDWIVCRSHQKCCLKNFPPSKVTTVTIFNDLCWIMKRKSVIKVALVTATLLFFHRWEFWLF